MVEVSVIIPVYNSENYLDECLDSVINQTFKDIEIICINDGSADTSLEILEKYEKLDNRMSVFTQENSGQSVARNNGIKKSKGKYIYFMDSDDYLELNALEEIYNISEKNNLELLIFKMINFNDGSNKKFTSRYYEMNSLSHLDGKIFNYADIGENALDFAVSPPGKLFKKTLIENIQFPENLIFEDNLFFAKAMINANRVSFYDNHLYNRRIRKDSTTQVKDIRFADSIVITNKIIDLAKEHGIYNDFKFGLAKKKIDKAFLRYSMVDEEFKEEFFKIVNVDFKSYEEEYENKIFNDGFDNRLKYVFRSFISSNNHEEFDLKMEIFDLEKNIKKIKKKNKKLKKELKDINEDINSSASLKIKKSLRNILNLFK